jgi:hypothetical protein
MIPLFLVITNDNLVRFVYKHGHGVWSAILIFLTCFSLHKFYDDLMDFF